VVVQLHTPRFRLLGHLEITGVSEDGVRGLKQRALLTYLLLHAGEIIRTERLVDAVWGEHPPPTATAIVHGYVRKLRAALAGTPAELVTRAPGYLLEVESDEIDVRYFERLAGEGRNAVRVGEWEEARTNLAEALSLWRGEPLADLPPEGFVGGERTRLEERRLEATLDRVDADLMLGRSGELVSELEALVRDHPFQERPRRQLMLALYRAGRQAEALTIYRDTRRLFVDELGIEPTRELQELEQAILRHDPSLALTAGEGRVEQPQDTRAGGRPRRWLIAGLLAVPVAVAAVAIPLTLYEGSASAPRARPAKILATFDLALPACCGFGFGSVWAAGHHNQVVQRIDPDRNAAVRRIAPVGYQAGVPLIAAGSLWVPSAAGPVSRIDPATGRILARIPVSVVPLTFGFLTVWGTTLDHRLVRIDLQTNRVVWSLRLASGSNSWVDELAIGYGSLWVAVADSGTLLRVDPTTRRIVARMEGFGRDDSGMPIALGEGAVWALRFVGGQQTLFRADPATNEIVARIPVGKPNGTGPMGTVTVGGGYVWTGNWDGTISKVDPRTNDVVAIYELPDVPQNVTYGEGSVWVDSYDASKVWRFDPNG
jgi:DNA-binding SARP family transcriptional activator/streptogramin lyase